MCFPRKLNKSFDVEIALPIRRSCREIDIVQSTVEADFLYRIRAIYVPADLVVFRLFSIFAQCVGERAARYEGTRDAGQSERENAG